MIDKVSADSGYNYLDHGRQGKNPSVQAYENTFSMKETEKKRAGKEQKPAQPAQSDPGVILDISSKPVSGKERQRNQHRLDFSWHDAVEKLSAPVKRIFQWIKDFWQSDAPQQDEELQLPPLEVEEADSSLIPDKVLKNSNLKQMEQILTQNGERRLAHNSDLLTYYDRKGMLVEMDGSEKYRVLFGDKHVLKL